MMTCNVSTRTMLLCILLAMVILTVPTSAQVNNCCSVDRQCTTEEEWVSGYYAYQNNQCAAPAEQQQSPPSSQPTPTPSPTTTDDVDNCCLVNRQCATDEEWVNGYNAYQNGQCGASSQQRSTSSQSQSQSGTSKEINNCCNSGWQCNTDEEWTSGYWAFQNDHCSSQSHWEEQVRKRQNDNQRQKSSVNSYPVKITYDPYTRTTVFEYEDGFQVTFRPPTLEELCEALKRDELPLLPECEED